MTNDISDWELNDDYYSNDKSSTLSFEDFVNNEKSEKVNTFDDYSTLSQTAKDIELVKTSTLNGMSIDSISKEFSLDKTYIKDILITIQSYPEDDNLAIARLLVMG
jgi:hypothetical protein